MNWNALLDRGVEQQIGATIPTGSEKSTAHPADLIPGPIGYEYVNQGGVDGRGLRAQRSFCPILGSQAKWNSFRATFTGWSSTTTIRRPSAPKSPAISPSRTPTTASRRLSRSIAFRPSPAPPKATKPESSICPILRYDVLDRPLGASPLYWSLGSVARLPQPFRASIPCPQRRPLRSLPSSVPAAQRRRLELRS